MESTLMRTEPAGQVADLRDVTERVRVYLAASMAANTTKAYRADWQHFTAWCDDHGLEALPAAPETVAVYLAALAETHKPATLTRRVSAISQAHQAAGYESPTGALIARKALAGIKRAKGTAQAAKAPLSVADLQRIVGNHLPNGTKGVRDRALLLVGFAAALRRSELVGIAVEHLTFAPEGMVITLTHSKTDQEAAGEPVGVPYGRNPDTCPVRALTAWLELAGITSGPVFRRVDRHGNIGPARLTDRAVALMVKHYAEAIGHDAAAFGGHSLRVGLATAAAQAGVHERDIMRQTRHHSTAMVRRYIRTGNLFRANAAGSIGL